MAGVITRKLKISNPCCQTYIKQRQRDFFFPKCYEVSDFRSLHLSSVNIMSIILCMIASHLPIKLVKFEYILLWKENYPLISVVLTSFAKTLYWNGVLTKFVFLTLFTGAASINPSPSLMRCCSLYLFIPKFTQTNLFGMIFAVFKTLCAHICFSHIQHNTNGDPGLISA